MMRPSAAAVPQAIVALVLLCGCHHTEPAGQRETTPVPAATAPATSLAAVPHEALPRSVAGVALGVSRAEAEGKLGTLSCHENKMGYLVCDATKEQVDDVRHLELYLNHDRVISLSYDAPAPANAWDTLNQLIDRYGRPALSGMRERDSSGRLHEIYGWKDDQSLYSVRFVWRDTPDHDRQLVGTSIALWDRKGYQAWETEKEQRRTPTVTADHGREPI